jgi:hypothetical protein
MKANAATSISSVGLVVFGKDEAGKPHASRFTAADVELALKAARLMGMRVMRPVSEAATTLAAKLPKGRVFASGRGFVPFVKPKVFEALLVTHADPQNQVEGGGDAGDAAQADPANAGDAGGVKSSGGDLGEGAVVLAPYAPLEGWWEAVIVKVKGDLFTLKWRDYPDDPVFARRRNQLVTIPPGVAAA